MDDTILLDSDVILKISIYALLICDEGGVFHRCNLSTLGASEYILPRRLSKARNIRNPQAAKAALAALLFNVKFIEPDTSELILAANLELAAQRAGLAFDVGESQLVALLAIRGARLLLTGDKRAIGAMGRLALSQPAIQQVAGKVACLEQLFIQLLATMGGRDLRASVCREPDADKALANCFCCASVEASDDQYLAGLVSYLNDLRGAAGQILCQGDFALSAAA